MPVPPAAPPHAVNPRFRRAGTSYALAAYGLWGILPLYFLLLRPAGPVEIVAWRILFSLVFCALLLTVTGTWAALVAVARQPKLLFTMGIAGALIFVNWQTYVVGTLSGHVVEAALGYFINPIVTIFLGVLVQRERLRPLQWLAVGISVGAVLVLAFGYGAVPWIALILAFSFGGYGLVKKRVGGAVDAVSGLTLETAWLIPVALGQLVLVSVTTGLTFGAAGPLHSAALLTAGVITAVPLLLFAAAARRMPLTVLGFFQYLAPLIQFGVGVFILGEPMPIERWIGFSLVWLALAVLIADAVLRRRTGRSEVASSLPPVAEPT